MRFFFFLFISFNTYALEIGEKVNFKIVKILPENLIETNIGKIDQVKNKEQIKIYADKKFIARALCVKVEERKSFWKLYRVVAPKKFSRGSEYQLKAIPLKDIPWNYIDKTVPEYQEIISTFTPEEKIERFEEEKPVSRTETRIFASPIKIESINNYNELHYGLEVQKKNMGSLDLIFGLESFRFAAEDQITEQKFSQSSFKIETFIISNNLFGEIDAFFGADYYTQKQGDFSPYKYQARLYPFGLRKDIEISTTVPNIAFYYSPILETYEMEEYDVPSDTLISTQENSLRHLLGVDFTVIPYEQFEIQNSFKLRPLHELEETVKIDFDNIDFENNFIIRYYPTKKFFIDYTNTYSLDKRRELYTNLDEVNIIHSLNFNYQL